MSDLSRESDRPLNRKSLAVLWTQAQPSVAAFIRSLVPDYHQAQDLLQQTAVVVFEKFETFDHTRPFVAWAIGIARIEVMRHRQGRARAGLVFNSDQVDRIVRAFESMDSELDDMRDALAACMDELPDRNRQLIRLRYGHQMSVAGIGEHVQMKPNAVMVALHRVRNALRVCIQRRLQRGDAPA